MQFIYTCCDCARLAFCEGLEDIPDPPRCWTCHAVAVLSTLQADCVVVPAEQIGAAVIAMEHAVRLAAPVIVVVGLEA